LAVADANLPISGVAFVVVSEQRGLAAGGNRDPILDAHGLTIGLIEHGVAGLVADRKNELLSLFGLGAGLKDHIDRHARRRHLLGRKNAVSVHRIVGTKIVVLEDQPRARRRDAHVWIAGCCRILAIGSPGPEQIEMPEQLVGRCSIRLTRNDENSNEQRKRCKPTHGIPTLLIAYN